MKRCPDCNGANTLEILLSSTQFVFAVPLVQRKKLLPKCSGVKACACADCGNIFGLKLENPEKLAAFADGIQNG